MIAKARKYLLLAAVVLTIIGCGSPNDQAPFDNDAQNHTPTWIADHSATAETASASCAECHGEEFAGGISGISCTSCHLGGPFSAHPTSWTQPIALDHSTYVELNGTVGCSNMDCHGTDLLGGTTGVSCTACHIGGTLSIHPADWAGQITTAHGNYVNINTTSSCSNIYCHGTNLEGVSGVSPACDSCHAMP
jgi:hypothetical protein